MHFLIRKHVYKDLDCSSAYTKQILWLQQKCKMLQLKQVTILGTNISEAIIGPFMSANNISNLSNHYIIKKHK